MLFIVVNAVHCCAENASEKDKRDFLNELVILKQVGKHPNVVCLVGACHIRGESVSNVCVCGGGGRCGQTSQWSL